MNQIYGQDNEYSSGTAFFFLVNKIPRYNESQNFGRVISSELLQETHSELSQFWLQVM